MTNRVRTSIHALHFNSHSQVHFVCPFAPWFNSSACIIKSVFSFLQMLTKWHCPHLPAAAAECRQCSNRSISPARRAHCSKPAAAGLVLWAHARTDRQMDTVPLQRPHSQHTMWVVPIKKRWKITETGFCRPGTRFTKYLTIMPKLRSTYDGCQI